MKVFRNVLKAGLDWVFLADVLAIFGIGLLFLYSTSSERGLTLSGNYFLRQSLWMVLALFAFWGILSVPFKVVYDFAYLLYGLNLFLLVLVLLFGRATRLGAQRWLDLGPFAFQPSEFLKITFVLAVSRFLSSRDITDQPIRSLLGGLALTVVPAFLILKEPHLGTALILFPVLLAILGVGGLRRDYLVWMIFLPLILSPLGYFLLKAYQKMRFLVFLNPDLDPLGAGYTIIQSRISIGSGWLFGKGFLAGTQTQLRFLPERHTDFIFSVIGEEWGFLGAAGLILLYYLLVKRALTIAGKSRWPFSRMVASGLATMLAVHLFVNIAMAMGFLPVVGLPLPFVSYGGSWLTACMITVALILSIGREGEF